MEREHFSKWTKHLNYNVSVSRGLLPQHMTAYMAGGLALSLGWSQTLLEWTIETQQRLFVFLERRDMKMYKGSHFCSPFCLPILRPGLIQSSGTLRTCLLKLTQEKLHWASHSGIFLCPGLLPRGLLLAQGVWLQSRGAREKAESAEGRAGGPRPWVPATALHWLLNSACLLLPPCLFIFGGMGSRLGIAEEKELFNLFFFE